MKKKFIGICIIVCMMVCVACGTAEDSENLFELDERKENSSVKLEERSGDNAIGYKDYAYGNMQKNVPSGNFMDYGKYILFIAPTDYGKNMLYTYDKQTGEVSLFCKDATCLHDSFKCVSAGAVANLELYEDDIYALNFDNEIMKLEDGKFEKLADGSVYYFWHANGTLYAVSRDSSLIEIEERKSNILMDEYTEYWNVCFGDYLYGCSSQGIYRVDLNNQEKEKELLVKSGYSLIDGEHIYYMDDKNFYLFQCDMDGNNSVQLTTESVLPASINFDDENLYFRLFPDHKLNGQNSGNIYCIEKKNPGSMRFLAQVPGYISTIYTVPGYEKIFVETNEESDEEIIKYYYSVSKDGKNIELLNLESSR